MAFLAAAVFLAAGLRATTFLVVVFFATAFFAVVFLAVAFFAAGLRTAVFLAVVAFLAAGLRPVALRPPAGAFQLPAFLTAAASSASESVFAVRTVAGTPSADANRRTVLAWGDRPTLSVLVMVWGETFAARANSDCDSLRSFRSQVTRSPKVRFLFDIDPPPISFQATATLVATVRHPPVAPVRLVNPGSTC